jgi:cell division protein FtsI/penicillin-binding protein 2
MIAEKHVPEASRLRPIFVLCGVLLLILVTTLGYRQLYQATEYREIERKQGHRRILRPGPRGDVLDRDGRLLIGNRAHYSAVIKLEFLREEIQLKKIKLVRKARQLKQLLLDQNPLQFETAMAIARNPSFGLPNQRSIKIHGKAKSQNRVKIHWQGKRLTVNQNRKGNWISIISSHNPNLRSKIEIEGADAGVTVDVAGLCKIDFVKKSQGELSCNPENSLSINGINLEWEARLAVVQKYLGLINQLCRRQEELSMGQLKMHWNRRLVLPMELAGDLKPQEYALLIEGIPVDSPVQIVTEAIRYYPYNSAASHVLGYVGSGYKSDVNAIPESDLATFELKGRRGKAGIEKYFDQKLRGQDGGDIWKVDPMGSKFQQVKEKQPRKGESLRLSLDADLQVATEAALSGIIERVATYRTLPDQDWRKAILRLARSAMRDVGEKEEAAELLLRAFLDAPVSLGPEEASTVAGFEGTQKDAERLLEVLYSHGVLERLKNSSDKYITAPPPLTPGAGVMIKIDTGEILVLASKPDYDLNDLSPRISQKTFQDIQRKKAWLPRAIHPGYSPASTFKLITAIGALRTGMLIPETISECDGKYKGMKCHIHPGRHGEMNLVNAISQSCNVFFYRTGQELKHKLLIAEAKRFEMHEQPSIELPSIPDSPIVPDPEWKMKRIGVKWTLEDTFNVSIGQGGLRQSPLRMACFAASLARRETRTRPTLIRKETSSRIDHGGTPIGLQSKHYDALIEGMLKSASIGTARRVKVPGISIAGKTGTGQWRNNNMKLNVAWFIGFAPVDKPEVAVAVLVEGIVPQDNIQGGLTATPVAQKMLQAYFDKKSKNLAKSR